jgi:hypothetical protein
MGHADEPPPAPNFRVHLDHRFLRWLVLRIVVAAVVAKMSDDPIIHTKAKQPKQATLK